MKIKGTGLVHIEGPMEEPAPVSSTFRCRQTLLCGYISPVSSFVITSPTSLLSCFLFCPVHNGAVIALDHKEIDENVSYLNSRFCSIYYSHWVYDYINLGFHISLRDKEIIQLLLL